MEALAFEGFLGEVGAYGVGDGIVHMDYLHAVFYEAHEPAR
jgi:hypothetical protein